MHMQPQSQQRKCPAHDWSRDEVDSGVGWVAIEDINHQPHRPSREEMP